MVVASLTTNLNVGGLSPRLVKFAVLKYRVSNKLVQQTCASFEWLLRRGDMLRLMLWRAGMAER